MMYGYELLVNDKASAETMVGMLEVYTDWIIRSFDIIDIDAGLFDEMPAKAQWERMVGGFQTMRQALCFLKSAIRQAQIILEERENAAKNDKEALKQILERTESD